jgi:hypothetical protein
MSPASDDVDAEHGSSVPAGKFVAVTMRSGGCWAPEATWRPGATMPAAFVSEAVEAAAVQGGAAYGY